MGLISLVDGLKAKQGYYSMPKRCFWSQGFPEINGPQFRGICAANLPLYTGRLSCTNVTKHTQTVPNAPHASDCTKRKLGPVYSKAKKVLMTSAVPSIAPLG